MRGAEKLEMGSDQLCEENEYANTSDLHVRKMRKTSTAKEIPAARNTQHRVILTLGVLLILVFLIVVILTGVLFLYCKSIQKEMLQMKNDSDVKHNLLDRAMAYYFSDNQRIMELLGKVAEDVQKVTNSSYPLCSEGWTRYGLSCYVLPSSSQPWNVSKKDCEDKEAHLIVINSEGEMNFLRGFANTSFLWLGLTDMDGTWRWVDGTPYDITPKFWEEGQPDDWTGHGYGGGEDCAVLRQPSNEWNDGRCSPNVRYVCEKKIVF
ncbi:C-type lectin domain family 10 member A-like [Rana temporaria]|uniref:C-type lectin domain family 10 member A-like n=1 Tax=Rana temporaria TaxID=8407 RepID=UPI001AAC88EF|nr:C-type lectin domain family 10 member A-like [Rana temporaria]